MLEEFLRAANLNYHQGLPAIQERLRRHPVGGDRQTVEIGHGKPGPGQVFERQIDPVAAEVNSRILPEICKLERRTNAVRESEQVGVTMTKQLEHQSAHGIRRMPAVGKQRREIRVAVGLHI